MAATEAEALWDHTVDLSLPVLLTDALIGRQPRQSPSQVVVIWLPYYKQPSRKLDYIHKKMKWNFWQMHFKSLQQSVLICCRVLTCGPIAPWFMCSLWVMLIKECLLWQWWRGSSWEVRSSHHSYHFTELIISVKLLYIVLLLSNILSSVYDNMSHFNISFIYSNDGHYCSTQSVLFGRDHLCKPSEEPLGKNPYQLQGCCEVDRDLWPPGWVIIK